MGELGIRRAIAKGSNPLRELVHNEEKMALVLGEFHVGVGTRGGREFFDLVHGFLRNENADLTIQASEFLVGLRKRETMAVSSNHRECVCPPFSV